MKRHTYDAATQIDRVFREDGSLFSERWNRIGLEYHFYRSGRLKSITYLESKVTHRFTKCGAIKGPKVSKIERNATYGKSAVIYTDMVSAYPKDTERCATE